MGNLLEAPILDKVTEKYSIEDLQIGMSCVQGWRPEMEDDHVVHVLDSLPGHVFLAVFDGHGGVAAANYSAANIVRVLESTDEFRKYKDDSSDPELLGKAMIQTMKSLDSEMHRNCRANPSPDFGGCTAVTAIITPRHIICANAGDSRCVMSTIDNVIPMSEDHKPINIEEKRRIENAGGVVVVNRVDGNLAVSRGLGDFEFKNRDDLPQEEQKVSCIPEIRIHNRDSSDECLILACDGLWDVFTNEVAIGTIRSIWKDGEHDVGLLAEEMLDMSIAQGSEDNVSAIIVKFPSAQVGDASLGGVMKRRETRVSSGQGMRDDHRSRAQYADFENEDS